MFNAAKVPVNVRAVVVPATVIPVLAFPVIMPSVTESVTVILPLATSTSANGVPVNTRLPLTSSVTVNDEGAETVGASFTAVIELLRTTVFKL